MSKDDFKYLSQESDSKVLDLVKQKKIYLMSTWMILKSLKKDGLTEKRFIITWPVEN